MTNVNRAETGQHFSETKRVNHYLWGLVSPDDSGYEEMVSKAVKQNGAIRAVNVRLKYQQTFVNGLVGVLTLGIYTPFTLTVEGDVVK